jgi:predicted molibdopterin-dependent oxidoreductase YjgC
LAEIATVCPYCGCGCGIYLQLSGGRVCGVSPSRSHPVSEGRLCLKGWHAHELVGNPGRLTRPLVRRGEGFEEASWDEAIAAVAEGLQRAMASDGPEAVGVLGSARCANEDNYVLVRFARVTLGTGNIDCSLGVQLPRGLSDQGEVSGLTESSGRLSDLDQSDLIFLVEEDPGVEHPAVAARVYRAQQRGARIITASTRRHGLARLSDIHLWVRPGTEVRWLGSLLHVLLTEQGVGRKAAQDLAALRASVADLQPEKTEAETGVPAAVLREAAALYWSAKRATVLSSTTLALSAQAPAALSALANVAELSRAGDGPEVTVVRLLSRCNAQGSRDMGVTPDWLPGYQPLGDDAAVQRLESAWGGPVSREQGLRAWEMLGRVQAMYVMGDDGFRAVPDARAARDATAKLDFLVVQDIFMSPMAERAHVVLPAAAFAERDGTWTSLERRVQRIRRAVQPPGQAREDWRIVAEVSAALGKPLPYTGAEEIFAEIADQVPIYGGLSYQVLEANGGAHWPSARAEEAAGAPGPPGGVRSGELPAIPAEAALPDPDASGEYPLLLAADPSLGAWDEEVTVTHLLTVAREFTVSTSDYPEGMICLNPEDAGRYGVRTGATVRVRSQVGEGEMRVRVTEEVPRGIALVPYAHATRLGFITRSVEPVSGRSALVPTPIAISVGERGQA